MTLPPGSGDRPTYVRRTPSRAAGRRPAEPRRAGRSQRVPARPAPPVALGSPIRRLSSGLLGLAVVLSVLGARLVQLQGLDSATYATRAAKQREHTIPVTADRGAILDRNGSALAMTVASRLVFADPGLTRPRKPVPGTTCKGTAGVAYADCAAGALSPLIGKSVAEVRAGLLGVGKPAGTRYVPLALSVTPSVARRINELGLVGIGTPPQTRRIYPSGGAAASVVGFVDSENAGIAGLERSQQDVLAGRNGVVVAEMGADGRQIPSAEHYDKQSAAGRDLLLTLDSDLQWRAQTAIAAAVKSSAADSGTVIVLNPRSGEVLAMAGAPTFDPADRRHAKKSDLPNRAVEDIYEPGSVNKVITAAAALQERVVTPASVFTVPNSLHRSDKVFHDAESHPTERLTFTGVLAKSSNIGTILASERVGKSKLYAYLRKFGFGERTGIGLPGESPGILPPPDTWSGTQQYTIPFGQGVSVTALQMASVYATVANGGVRVTPTLVRGTADGAGHTVPAPPPARHRVVSARTAAQLRDMLEAVTGEQGTAPRAKIAGYRVAGKTGTAQRAYHGGYSGYTASFIGFAPADKPALVVAVVLQNPRSGHFGGQIAAPVFHDVMSFALSEFRIPPTGTTPPVARLTAPRPALRTAPRPHTVP